MLTRNKVEGKEGKWYNCVLRVQGICGKESVGLYIIQNIFFLFQTYKIIGCTHLQGRPHHFGSEGASEKIRTINSVFISHGKKKLQFCGTLSIISPPTLLYKM